MSLSHHNLVAWQRADDLFTRLHRLSLKAFPAIERFALGAQLRRAAFSAAVNIVEGFARPAGRGRLNFLNISLASLAEVGYCIHVALRLGYLSKAEADDCETEIKRVGAPLAGLIRSERNNVVVQVGTALLVFGYVFVRLSAEVL
jgi:four helix bundle protein